MPHPRKVIPHRYVKVTDRDAFRFDEPPDASLLTQIQDGDALAIDEVGARPLDGAYFLAIDQQERAAGRPWLRTHEGNYVRPEVTEAIDAPQLVGADLTDKRGLPMAFVIKPEVRATRIDDDKVVGSAKRYARVPIVDATLKADDRIRQAYLGM